MINGNITFRKLEIFLTFMDKRNISQVAEELNLSSVSVHRALHSLEENIGCPLFIHRGRNLQPLPSAYTFLEYTKQISSLTEEAICQTYKTTGLSKKRLKIGTIYSLTLEILPQLVMDFKVRKPDVEINLTMGSNRDLLNQLEHSQLDVILIAISDSEINKNLFEIFPLFDDDIFITGPINSPLLNQPCVNLQNFKNQPFIALTEGFATYHSFCKAFSTTDFKPNITMYVNDIFSLMNLVQAGVGYSLLPGRVKKHNLNKIKIVPFKKNIPINQTIGLVFPKTLEYDLNILAFLATCRMYIHDKNK